MNFYDADQLTGHGLVLPSPQSVHVSRDVDLGRLSPGAVLHPGARLSGSQTALDAGAEVGTQGVARIHNVALGRGASIASGTAEECVLLDGASLGPNAHVRAGTLLEEEASTGHAVGLKQTVLLSFVTLGSQINFCDCLMAGGTSRSDHSEVGSGFIHFNFTPFGKKGDKATASLFGDVTTGVFLASPRIFLGGSGGVVGPVHVDYGTTLAAGSVYRKDYARNLLVYGEKTIARSRTFDPLLVRGFGKRTERCLRYIGELRALYAWYEFVRLPAADGHAALVLEEGRRQLAGGIAERAKQIDRFLDGGTPADNEARADQEVTRARWEGLRADFACAPDSEVAAAEREQFLDAWTGSAGEHIQRIQALDVEVHEKGRSWLATVAEPEPPTDS